MTAFLLGEQPKAAARATLEVQKSNAGKLLLGNINESFLPKGAIVNPDFSAAFVLKAGKEQDLAVVTVYYNFESNPTPKGRGEQCGVFFVAPDGSSSFIPTIGPDFQDGTDLCGGVRAAGLSSDPGSRPRIIVIFDNTLLHGEEFPLPFVFAWNAVSKAYGLDKKTTEWLLNQTQDAGTVPKIRRLLSQHHSHD